MFYEDNARLPEARAAGQDNRKRGLSRRVVLVGGGGLTLASAAAAAFSGVLGGALDEAGRADALRGWRGGVPRQAAASVELPLAARRQVPRQRVNDQAVPAPMYFLDDGPAAIALTVDDGPNQLYTPQVLRILDKYGITASFSMIGRNVEANPGVARDVAAAGHMIINHTWDHADLAPMRPGQVRDEIERATDMIHAATDQRPRMFRAPYGLWSPLLLGLCQAAGLRPLDWSVDPKDWARPGVARIVRNILTHTRSGSIILEHDGGGDRAETVAALAIVIPRLLDLGYHFRAP